MPDEFPYDVFLSHSAKDKAVVRPLAERLRTDRLLNNSQPPRGSDWAQLESGTLRTGQRPFRDPLKVKMTPGRHRNITPPHHRRRHGQD